MYIYGLLDFFIKKDEIKEEYEKMIKEEKRYYKMYIYSLCFEYDDTKDLIWEYLNDDRECISELYKTYYERKRTVDRYGKNKN